jgi:hypothetical protein
VSGAGREAASGLGHGRGMVAREPCQTGGRSGTGATRGLACYSMGNSTSTLLIAQLVGGPLPRSGGRAGGPGAGTGAAFEHCSRA